MKTSNGKSLRRAGNVTIVFETMTRVRASGVALATASAPMAPEAPGLFSTTMDFPGPAHRLTVRASTLSVPPGGNGTMIQHLLG